jgi:hypothetical protein
VNATALRDTLAPYIAARRREARRRSRARPQVTTTEDQVRNKQMRAWLVGNGYALNARGRIPSELVEAWREGIPRQRTAGSRPSSYAL